MCYLCSRKYQTSDSVLVVFFRVLSRKLDFKCHSCRGRCDVIVSPSNGHRIGSGKLWIRMIGAWCHAGCCCCCSFVLLCWKERFPHQFWSVFVVVIRSATSSLISDMKTSSKRETKTCPRLGKTQQLSEASNYFFEWNASCIIAFESERDAVNAPGAHTQNCDLGNREPAKKLEIILDREQLASPLRDGMNGNCFSFSIKFSLSRSPFHCMNRMTSDATLWINRIIINSFAKMRNSLMWCDLLRLMSHQDGKQSKHSKAVMKAEQWMLMTVTNEFIKLGAPIMLRYPATTLLSYVSIFSIFFLSIAATKNETLQLQSISWVISLIFLL